MYKLFPIVLTMASLTIGCTVPSITVNVPKELATSIDKLQQPVAVEAADEPAALTTQRTMVTNEPEAEVVIPHIEGAGHVGPTPKPGERDKATTKASPTPGPSPTPRALVNASGGAN